MVDRRTLRDDTVNHYTPIDIKVKWTHKKFGYFMLSDFDVFTVSVYTRLDTFGPVVLTTKTPPVVGTTVKPVLSPDPRQD